MDAVLTAVTFDCRDAALVAAFWAELTGRPVDEGGSPAFAAIGLQQPDPHRPAWMFFAVPEAKVAKNRCHVDLHVADLPAAVEHAVAAGATRLGAHDEFGFTWVCLADPEGNEFDLVAAG